MLTVVLTSGTSALDAQIFSNGSDAYDIAQYNWNGHFGAAITMADWDNDGWPDLTFGGTNGAIRTWRNLGGTGFEMMPLPWVSDGETKSLLWADFDNDGDDDLFVLEVSGRCGFVENDGNGGFDLTRTLEASAKDLLNCLKTETESGGASFGDMDGDGDLDLHICRYVELPNFEEDGLRNVLLRNDGNFSFTNVTEESGIDVHMRLSFQSAWWDFNEDGLQDVLVINDKAGANSMFENQGDGTFVDVAADIGADIVIDAMTLTLGDFNQDGRQDLYHTNTWFGGDGLGSKLLVQQENGHFTEESAEHNLALDQFCWGAAWMDVDNDTDLDLFVAEHNGLGTVRLELLVGKPSRGGHGHGRNEPLCLKRLAKTCMGLDYLNSHVVASGDLDRNGWVDFVVHNVGNHKARIWMNGGFGNGNSSVTIGLHGIVSNPDAAGAKLTVHSPSASQSRIIHVGENYLSQESEYEVFGLGTDTSIDSVTVVWPSGLVELFDPAVHELAPGGFYVLEEGSSLCTVTHQTQVVCDFPSLVESYEGTGSFDVTWTQAETLWEDLPRRLQWTCHRRRTLDDVPLLAGPVAVRNHDWRRLYPLARRLGHQRPRGRQRPVFGVGGIGVHGSVQRRLGQRPHRGHRGPDVLPRLVRGRLAVSESTAAHGGPPAPSSAPHFPTTSPPSPAPHPSGHGRESAKCNPLL